MSKQTSPKISSRAAYLMNHPQEATPEDIVSICASAVSQDETSGQSGKRSTVRAPSDRHMARAFNEWMRRYIDEPTRFAEESAAINTFLREEHEGREPSYGEQCVAYLNKLLEETEDT